MRSKPRSHPALAVLALPSTPALRTFARDERGHRAAGVAPRYEPPRFGARTPSPVSPLEIWSILAHMRSKLAAALAFCALFADIALAQPSPSNDLVRARVHIAVLRQFPEAWIDPIARALEQHLNVQAIVETEPLPLPDDAYYAPRRRYRAEVLLGFLGTRFGAQPNEDRVLALTARDISTSTERFHDWGILGLADIGGRAAVVSSFRMRRRAHSAEHALWRMTTTAVHETGHVLGLPHCDEARCIMRDAQGTMDTVDAGDGDLGAECQRLLDRGSPRTVSRR